MRKILFLLLILQTSYAQTLTVDKIMQDPKWMGTSPSNAYWSPDSKTLYFQWNPDKKTSDSTYSFTLNSKAPLPATYKEAQLAAAIHDGTYNKAFSQLVYSYKGDIFLLDIALNKTIRITQTGDEETNPSFVKNDEWVTYQVNRDVFTWSIKTGITQQLTAFTKGTAKTTKDSLNAQQQWLKNEQLTLFDVLKERKRKRDERDSLAKNNKDADTLHLLYTVIRQCRPYSLVPMQILLPTAFTSNRQIQKIPSCRTG